MGLNMNFRSFWDTLNSTIPSGWGEDIAFTDKYLQGDTSSFTGSGDGGNANHLHTSSPHTHTGDPHTHSFSAGGSTGGAAGLLSGAAAVSSNGAQLFSHSHISTTSNAATITYQTQSVGSSSSTAMQPPSVRMIVIKPNDGNQEVADGAFAFTDQMTAPTGYTITGSGGTNDHDARFIIGPASNGGNGGDTLGSATHGHTILSTHTHVIDDHSHPARTTGTPAISVSSGTTLVEKKDTHHDVILTNKALSDLSASNVTVDSASSEPSWVKLLGIFNTSGGQSTPINTVLPFVGDISGGTPTGWDFLTSSSNRQIQITKTGSEVGNTGGSDTHTHTNNHVHTHTGSHNHGVNVVFTPSAVAPTPFGFMTAYRQDDDGHTHTWTVSSTTPTLQNASITLSSPDARYFHRSVAFLKKISEALVEQNAMFYGCNF